MAQEQALRRKGGTTYYDDETRAKIAKYPCDNGNKNAISTFSVELGHVVTESTVRNMKMAYLSLLKKEKDPDKVQRLQHAAI